MDGDFFKVTGHSWLDREFATNQLGEEQAGWDWLALNFDDGSALMLYRMRLKNGTQDIASSGTWIDAQGQSHHLEEKDFRMQPLTTWQSPKSGANYPTIWEISINAPVSLKLKISALLADQEMQTDATTLTNYWEGAVIAESKPAGDGPGLAYGYLEMTGYDLALTTIKDNSAQQKRQAAPVSKN